MRSSSQLLAVVWCLLLEGAMGHGRMNDPPGRSTMWRLGYSTPKNYNDMEVWCGGISRLWEQNGGKCGVCGDPYDLPQPRDNEAGGKYGNGIIVKRYTQGQTIKVQIQLTANHKGHFEFRICPTNNPKLIATEACMNNNQLRTPQGKTEYYIDQSSNFEVELVLPSYLTCSQCVFQWKYIAANNIGFGKKQEHFYSCADVSISGNIQPPITNRPVFTQPPITNRPVFTQPPITNRPVFTQPPITNRPVFTQPPITNRPVFTQPPITNRPVFTQPPITNRPVFTQPPITNRPPQPVQCKKGCDFYCKRFGGILCPQDCLNCYFVN